MSNEQNNNIMIERIEDTYQGLPRYEVLRDGEAIGIVYREEIGWSRSAPGKVYTYASGTTMTWRFVTEGRGRSARCDTRKEAIKRLITELERAAARTRS